MQTANMKDQVASIITRTSGYENTAATAVLRISILRAVECAPNVVNVGLI